MSEVLSFILTFSILTMLIGILYSAGFVSLTELQTGNQMQNAEGVFFAISDSFTDLQEGQAPKRAGSLDLDVGASLTVVNESQLDVTVNGRGYSTSLVTRSLDYRLEDRAVSYETGAVFRSNGDQSTMVKEPAGIFCSPSSNASVVSVVTLVAPDGASVAAGTATITGVKRSTELVFPEDPDAASPIENVTIDVASPREAAWERYLQEAPGWTDPEGDGTYACEAAEQVFIRHTVVEVQIAN